MSEQAAGGVELEQNEVDGAPAEASVNGAVFYRVNRARLSFRELNREKKTRHAFWIWLSFKLGAGELSLEDPAVESLAPFRKPYEEMEENERPLFEQLTKELLGLGFHSPAYHSVNDMLQKSEYRFVTLAHRSRPIAARVRLRVWHGAAQPKLMGWVDLLTEFTDGTSVRTSNMWLIDGPKSCRVVVVPKAGAAELLRAHEQAMGDRMSAAPARPAGTQAQAVEVMERAHEAWRDHHLARGLLVPQRAGDAERQASLAAGFGAAVKGASRHPAVYAELEALQRRNGSVAGMVVLLLVSLGLFLALGLRGQSLLRVLALVPVLFVHELGHFVAMKAFGYRNVRMFFIPGLGAAVTGRHYNVPAWKKAVVFLMGPLPGIVLGIIIGLVGILLKKPLLMQAGLLTTLLNGFNLIPILPLDGGHVLHLILFSRSRVLDMAVRTLAALGMMGLAMYTKSYILIGVGAAALAGLSQTNRMQRVVAALRSEGVPTASEDDQTVPVEVADRSTDKLLEASKSTRPPMAKLLAAQVSQVFEALNTRPPGVLASLGLGTVHLLGFVAAVVFSLVFAFSSNGKLQQFMRQAANQPKHEVVGAVVVNPDRPSGSMDAACATFKTKGEADAAFESLRAGAAAGQTVARFGDTVVVYYASGDEVARKQAVDAVHGLTPDYFVASKDMRASFRFQALVADEGAKDAAKELSEYFQLPYNQPMAAPWSKVTQITPRQRMARKTYVRIEEVQRELWKDPEIEALDEKAETARKRGELAEAKALSEQVVELRKKIRRSRIAALRGGADVHNELVDAYLSALDTSTEKTEYEDLNKAAAPFLGAPSPGDLTYALDGYANSTSYVLDVYVSFADPVAGATAFTEWLTAKKCTKLKYDLTGRSVEEGED